MLNNAWPSLIPIPSPSSHSLFLHLLHLPLVASPSTHHSTQQINYMEKLRLANQGDGRIALGTKSKKKKKSEQKQMNHLSLCKWSNYLKKKS